MQKCKIITQDINNQNQPFPHLFLCPLSTVPPNVKWPIGIHFLHPNYYKTTFRLTFATLMVSILPPKFCPKVGRWGMLRFNYLRKHREALYTIMLMEGTLNPHLEDVDRQTQETEQ